MMCDCLRRLLSQSYRVETVTDGVAAMAAIDRQPPDLVLTDVVMPNLDGLELLRSIRADPATQDIPVILLSAHAEEESRITGLEAGADDYIIKPFSSRELVARVDATLKLVRLRLSGRDRERELQQENDTVRANLDRIVANINNGFATFDRQWRYTYVNNRLLEIFNLDRAAVLGKQAWEVFPAQVGIEFFDLLNRAMTERVEEQFEYYYDRVDCWVEHRVYPTDDGLAILMADVTEQKAALRERERSELEYQTLFESIDEGFCIIEMLFNDRKQPVDYRFLQVNPAFFELTGLPLDALGKTMRELVPDIENFWMENYGKVVLTGEAVRFENYSAQMNRWFDVYARRVGDATSRRLAIVFDNITERKHAEAAVAANLRDTQLLRELGAQLIGEDNPDTFYSKVLAAAVAITSADAGTVQMLDESTQDLCLIATQGFESTMTDHFARVNVSSDTSCGRALQKGARMFVDFDDPSIPDPDGSIRLHLEEGLGLVNK